MMDGSAIIIGSGLGGLECGYILARHGLEVTVLEQSNHTGGCLQTYVRGRALFDTGFQYAGGLGDGEPLNRLFSYFGLMSLPWKQLDPECADEVVIGDRVFPFASGHRRFAERLTECFPHEKEAAPSWTGLTEFPSAAAAGTAAEPTAEELAAFIRHETGLYLSAGNEFGGNGSDFLRMNIAHLYMRMFCLPFFHGN